MILPRRSFAALGLALLANPVEGEIIYSESFSAPWEGITDDGTDPLHGTTPDVTVGTNAWTAYSNATNGFREDGLIPTSGGTGDAGAYLPFTPTSGFVYTLSVTVTAPTGDNTTGWAGLGFTADNDVSGGIGIHESTNLASPWMLYRQNGAVVTFDGPGATGATSTATGAYSGTQTMTIVLDTTAAQWTAEWFMGATSIDKVTYTTNPTINYLAIGRGAGNENTFSNFSLTVDGANGPQLPSQLSGFTYDPATGVCTVDLKGNPGTTYKLVEADDLDFTNPDQDPVPLTDVTVGTPVGALPAATGVTTDGNGDATVEFNLGTTKDKSFIRAEETTP